MRLNGRALLAAAGVMVIGILLSSPVAGSESSGEDRSKAVLGWVEWAVLPPGMVRIKSKLDTGALTSSLHATDIEAFERDGEDWVRFSVPLASHKESVDDDSEVRGFAMEQPVTRTVLIKRHGAESQRRYVVTLPFCVDGREYETQFSLTDRSDFTYAILFGRRFLEDHALVDAGESFLATEDCEYAEVGALAEDEREEFEALSTGDAGEDGGGDDADAGQDEEDDGE